MLETVTKNKNVQFIHLGEVDYKEGWDYQDKLFWESVSIKVANRKRPQNEQEPTFNYLIFCSHPHVYTLGRSGDENNLLLNPKELEENEAKFYKINTGYG